MRISDRSSDVCSSDLLAAGLKIRSIPTLMVFREQVLLFSQAGALSPAQLQELIEQVKEVDMEKVHAEIAAQQNGSEQDSRTEESRVGKEWVSKCRSRWSRYP